MKFRLLTTGYNPASYNMALDESVLDHIAEGLSPSDSAILRLEALCDFYRIFSKFGGRS